MKEKSLKFNGEMVQAILDGRKTQTRLPVKPQPKNGDYITDALGGFHVGQMRDSENAFREIKPKYQVGEKVWVRECFQLEITGVRVDMIQALSLPDLEGEGFKKHKEHSGSFLMDTQDSFEEFINLWDSIYADKGYGWYENPYVWVYEFKGII